MVARPLRSDKVEVEYVDGARKWVDRRRLSELSSRWRVVNDPAQPEGQPDQAPPEPPAESAVKGAWHQYALDRGASRERLEGMTKAQLIDEFGPKDQSPAQPESPASRIEPDQQPEDATSGEDQKG